MKLFSHTNKHENVLQFKDAIFLFLLYFSAQALSVYLQLRSQTRICAVLVVLSFSGYFYVKRTPLLLKEKSAFFLFSLVISIVLVLGYHIHTQNTYTGTIEQNYIMPYSLSDCVALLLMLPSLYVLLSALFRLITNTKEIKLSSFSPSSCTIRKYIIFLVLFICYIPYLLLYWPGILLGDTTSSIEQALGITPLANHHPVLYTLFIRLCINLGEILFNSRTVGYGLYTTIQMLYVSFCLACLIDWIWRASRCHTLIGVGMVTLFGLSPHFAAFSVAGWKDPIFSITVAVLSLYLLDDVLWPQNKKSLKSHLLFSLLLLITVFGRNNGIGIIVFVAIWQLANLVFFYKSRGFHRNSLAAISVAVIAIYLIVTGPIYNHAGIRTDKREANSLFLQQMARVAALDGEMSETEKAFLNELLPIELYASTYRPCCVDLLKWNGNFNAGAITLDLYKNWLTLFIKNPLVYFEAWQLNTFGFWTLNNPGINYTKMSITDGVVRNNSDQYITEINDAYGLNIRNLLGNDAFRHYFPTDAWFVPIGWIFWSCVFLTLCLCLSKKYVLLSALIPTFGLILPLILFTPIYYWMRYAAAMQYLLPLYLFLFRIGLSKKLSDSRFHS